MRVRAVGEKEETAFCVLGTAFYIISVCSSAKWNYILRTVGKRSEALSQVSKFCPPDSKTLGPFSTVSRLGEEMLDPKCILSIK